MKTETPPLLRLMTKPITYFDKLDLRQNGIETSPKMTAILGYFLEQRYTDPEIVEMMVTSDRMVLARHEGDIGMNLFIGSVWELFENLVRYADACGLTDEEFSAWRRSWSFNPTWLHSRRRNEFVNH